MKRIIIIAALIAGLYSCRTSNNEDKDFVYKINLDDAKIVVTHDISDFCDSVETIVLDTSDSVLLASVNKLIPTKNRILILDRNIRNRNGSTVADFDIEKYYFPVGMHLKGWTNVTIIGGNNFLYNAGNNYCLFANENSNEIFKLTSDDVINYISVESENFIGEEERRIISESRKQKSGAAASGDYKHPIHFDRYWGIRNYFETDRYICFAILRGKALHTVLYDKNSKETQMAGWPNLDLIIKRDYPEVHSCLQFLQADTAGVFYCVPPEKLDLFRTAAREGMLVDGLDRLDELKRLPDESNTVVFYLKFEN